MSNKIIVTRRVVEFLGEMAGVDFLQCCSGGFMGAENQKGLFCDSVLEYGRPEVTTMDDDCTYDIVDEDFFMERFRSVVAAYKSCENGIFGALDTGGRRNDDTWDPMDTGYERINISHLCAGNKVYHRGHGVVTIKRISYQETDNCYIVEYENIEWTDSINAKYDVLRLIREARSVTLPSALGASYGVSQTEEGRTEYLISQQAIENSQRQKDLQSQEDAINRKIRDFNRAQQDFREHRREEAQSIREMIYGCEHYEVLANLLRDIYWYASTGVNANVPFLHQPALTTSRTLRTGDGLLFSAMNTLTQLPDLHGHARREALYRAIMNLVSLILLDQELKGIMRDEKEIALHDQLRHRVEELFPLYDEDMNKE